ncbi:Transducin (beta)-like 3 [Desmophyllum pertusum]|uniref:Transducin (Beta)-like 3 n=1 Tax=Desmophyllum pertusum TaxID=174260 RepID=A0A9X0CLJ6_9CNID|nr:Transducin (beta)-like 3 [Desmophyllum pertusum]
MRDLGVVAVVTFDHNIVFQELESLKRTKQFVGYNDEILDLCFAGGDESHLAVATNSSQLRIYDMTSMNCQLLEGHTDIVFGSRDKQQWRHFGHWVKGQYSAHLADEKTE